MKETTLPTASIRCYICGSQIRVGDEQCTSCARIVSAPEKEALEHRRQTDACRDHQTPRPAQDFSPLATHIPALAPTGDLEATWADFVAPRNRRFGNTGLMLLTFVLFLLCASGRFNLVSVVWLASVLLVHELGHLAAMKLFGYRDLRVFFIPFLGAVATGRSRVGSAWQRGVVALAGPLPGMLLGWALIIFLPAQVGSSSSLRTLVGMLLAINAFNLLPLLPLDGGRLLNHVLFARRPGLEMAFQVLTAGGLVLLAVSSRSWLLASVGVFVVFTSQTGRRISSAAQRFRAQLVGTPSDVDTWADDQRRALFEAARHALAPAQASLESQGRPLSDERRRKALASYMGAILDRATATPTGVAATAILLCVYLASCALALPILRIG